jgi:hypothetical protein
MPKLTYCTSKPKSLPLNDHAAQHPNQTHNQSTNKQIYNKQIKTKGPTDHIQRNIQGLLLKTNQRARPPLGTESKVTKLFDLSATQQGQTKGSSMAKEAPRDEAQESKRGPGDERRQLYKAVA